MSAACAPRIRVSCARNDRRRPLDLQLAVAIVGRLRRQPPIPFLTTQQPVAMYVGFEFQAFLLLTDMIQVSQPVPTAQPIFSAISRCEGILLFSTIHFFLDLRNSRQRMFASLNGSRSSFASAGQDPARQT